MGVAGALRPVGQGLHRAVLLPFWGGEAFSDGREIRGGELLADHGPGLNDRVLADLLDTDSTIFVSVHIRSMDQNEAIKTVKRKITDLDSMKIDAQKRAAREGFDMDIIPPISPPTRARQRTSSGICRAGMKGCS